MSIRENLEAIKEKRGKLTPELVVDEARSESHPLHKRFEWDDTIAGESWRREQARKLIIEVEVTYSKQDGTRGHTRGFYAIQREGNYVYESTEEIVKDPISREILLSSMKRDWE